jgi:hypothetical protein
MWITKKSTSEKVLCLQSEIAINGDFLFINRFKKALVDFYKGSN